MLQDACCANLRFQMQSESLYMLHLVIGDVQYAHIRADLLRFETSHYRLF